MNPYEILQISKTATIEVIRAAWSALVRQCHPDGPKPDKLKTQRLNEAYAVLKDPVKKEALDRQLAVKIEKPKPVRERRQTAVHVAPNFPNAYPDPYPGISQEDIDNAIEDMTSRMNPLASLAVKIVYGQARRRQ